MFQDSFTKLTKEDVEKLLPDVNKAIGDIKFEDSSINIMTALLPFYPDYHLLHVSDTQNIPVKECYLVGSETSMTMLDWSPDVIHGLNKNIPIQLTDETIGDYVRFYYNYVRGPHGKFVIVDSVEDIDWNDEPPLSAVKAVGQMIEPLTIVKKDDNGLFHACVCMIFRGALFKISLSVNPDGVIEFINEELLIEDMPVFDSVLEV